MAARADLANRRASYHRSERSNRRRSSRREVERWIREGRLQVNGEVPALGTKLTLRDRITLDGRPVRLHTPAVKELRVLLFHRSPGETLDLKAATSRAAEHLNLPRASGRWLAISSWFWKL